MADFSSRVSIDASQAVASLNQLDEALSSSTVAMGTFQAVADKNIGGDGFAQVAKSAKQFERSGTRAMRNVANEARRVQKPIQAIGLSYRDVGRIVESQIIFATLSAVRQGFFEAADAAAEFQLQISRIAAIDEEGFGFARLRDEVEQLAIDLGRPIEEVGEAAFEALQNDLGSTSETFQILRKDAQELALVTGGNLTQAVNALSSVYKTFGEDAEAVNGISGQFFGTINAGRITLADLESSLGTLSPLAIQVGVTFKELTDSLATITLTGTKANVATTQLRNVFNKLIKPTERLQEVYRDLGVNGFQELSERQGGFVNALQALENEVGDSEDGLARLFNTIRANVGVLNILTDNTRLYQETANRSAKSAQRLDEAIAGIEGTAAREAARNASELDVIFNRLGDTALNVQNDFVNAFLAITNSSEEGVIAITGVAGAFTAATIAVTKFRVAALSAFPAAAAFVGIVGGFLALAKGIDLATDAFTATNREIAELEVERLNALVETINDIQVGRIADLEEKFKDTNLVINQIAESARETGRAIVDAFNIQAGDIAGVEGQLLESFGDARVRVLDQVRNAIEDIDNEIIAGRDRIRGLEQELRDFSFEIGLEGLNEFQRTQKLLERSAGSIEQAFRDAGNVGLSEESQEIARQAGETAKQQAKAALSAARRTGNAVLIRRAETQVQEAISAQLATERRLVELRESTGVDALLKQERIFNRISGEAEQQLKTVSELRKELAEAESEGAGAERINELTQQLADASTKARELLNEAVESQVLETFDLEEQFGRAVERVQSGLDSTKLDWSNAIDQLKADLAARDDLQAAVTLTARIQELAGRTGNEAVTRQIDEAAGAGGLPGDQLARTAQAALDVLKEQQGLFDTIESSSAQAEASANEARLAIANAARERKLFGDDASELVTAIEGQLSRLGDLTASELENLIEQLGRAPEAIQENAEGLFPPFSEAQADFLNEAVQKTIEAAQAALEGVKASEAFDQENLDAAKQLFEEITQTELGELGLEIDTEGFQAAERALARIKAEAKVGKDNVELIGRAGRSAGEGIAAVANSTNNLQQAANNARGAYQALLNIANQAFSVAQQAANLNAQNGAGAALFFGGKPLYRNSGGPGRGQDTVPAMLSPGEFVVNARSARNFLPELQSINAGNARDARGGSGDTNITIGDIKVSSSTDVPSQTARDIANSIKRELRRGTTRL